MIQASFLEQIETIKNAFISNQYLLYVLLVALGAIILLELIGKIKSKKNIKDTMLIYIFNSIWNIIILLS